MKKKAKAKKAKAEPATLQNQAAVARRFGVVSSTVRHWLDRGLPRNPSGTFSRKRCDAWVAEFRRRTAPARTPGGARWNADLRWRESRAKKLELQAANLEASLIPVEEHARAIELRGEFFRGRLEAIARRVAAGLAGTTVPGEIEECLAREYDVLLWEAYEKGSAD